MWGGRGGGRRACPSLGGLWQVSLGGPGCGRGVVCVLFVVVAATVRPTRRLLGRPRLATSHPSLGKEESLLRRPNERVSKWLASRDDEMRSSEVGVDVAGGAVRGGAESLRHPGENCSSGVVEASGGCFVERSLERRGRCQRARRPLRESSLLREGPERRWGGRGWRVVGTRTRLGGVFVSAVAVPSARAHSCVIAQSVGDSATHAHCVSRARNGTRWKSCRAARSLCVALAIKVSSVWPLYGFDNVLWLWTGSPGCQAASQGTAATTSGSGVALFESETL